MRSSSYRVLSLFVFVLSACTHEAAEPLNTGKFISPATQSSADVGNMPMNLALTPDGRYALVSDMGYHQSLWSIRTSDGRGVSHINFEPPKEKKAKRSQKPSGEDDDVPTPPGSSKSIGLYYGLAVSDGNAVYAAQGAHDSIAVLNVNDDGAISPRDSIKTNARDFPAGLALDDRGFLYVANNASGDGDPTKLSGSVAIYDTTAKTEIGRYAFSNSHGGTSNFPLGIAVLRSGATAYVAAERDDAVYALDTRDAAKPALLANIVVGSHPVALILSSDQTRLFVANSLSDTVSVIDTKSNTVVATILLRPECALCKPHLFF
jgi:YVTN family beta-propeller protein